MAEIKVRNLHKEFGVGEDKVVALEDVNLEIGGHVFVSIVGRLGLWQVDAAQHPERHRDADQRPGHDHPGRQARPTPATSSRRRGCCRGAR